MIGSFVGLNDYKVDFTFQNIVVSLAIVFTCTPSLSFGQTLNTRFHRNNLASTQSELKWNSKIDGAYCAPGMDCASTAFKSQDSLAHKVSIIGVDDRQYVSHARGTKYSPVGAIFNRTLSRDNLVQAGTAWLIDECYILTSAHLVTGSRSSPRTIPTGGTPRRPLEPVDIAFVAGRTADGTFEILTNASVAVIGNYKPNFPNFEEDWALLRIKDCLGKLDKFGHFTVAGLEIERAVKLQNRVISAGFPGDRDYKKGLTIDPSCSIQGTTNRDYSPDVWAIDCATVGGDSGGPLLVEGKSGNMIAIGIKIADLASGQDYLNEYTPDRANVALSLRSIIPKIQPFLPTDHKADRK